ncbi:hypothetical protein [Clostridium tetani]|uniref:hypothetical protein n=1 Tax=Clostridium tetani TaxID=1513 RepID=UPI000A402331|nr:hypothetical protein [Clostridium tetani]
MNNEQLIMNNLGGFSSALLQKTLILFDGLFSNAKHQGFIKLKFFRNANGEKYP